MHKGSYYLNPLSDDSGASDELRKEHPSYLRNNIWPSSDDCPGFEDAVKALARFMVEVGKRLAKACDHLVAKHSDVPSIEALIADSQCSKARLLHYYPPADQKIRLHEKAAEPADRGQSSDEPSDSWCGTHLVSRITGARTVSTRPDPVHI